MKPLRLAFDTDGLLDMAEGVESVVDRVICCKLDLPQGSLNQ